MFSILKVSTLFLLNRFAIVSLMDFHMTGKSLLSNLMLKNQLTELFLEGHLIWMEVEYLPLKV